MSEEANTNQREVAIPTPSNRTGGGIYNRLRRILKTVSSIDFFKLQFERKYKLWDIKSGTVVKELKDREKAIANVTRCSNVVKVVADVGRVVGSGAILASAICTDNETVSNVEKIGAGVYSLGTVISKGSTTIDKWKTKENYKEAKGGMDNLIECTEELDSVKREYLRLLEEYEGILDDLDKEEIQFLFDYVNQHSVNISNVQNCFHSSVQDFIPPTLPKMETLKLDEKLLHVEKFKFNLMTKIAEFIRKDPLLSEIWKWKCKILPTEINEENVIKGCECVQLASNCKALFNIIKPITLSDDGTKNSRQLLNVFANTLFLATEIFNLVTTCLSIQEEKAQIEEIRRAVTELENYRTEVRETLKTTLRWECFQTDWYLEQEQNGQSLQKLNS